MLKVIFTLFYCGLFSALFSQAPSLITTFKVSDDIAAISAKIKLQTVAFPTASDILSKTINSCYNAACGSLPVQLLSLDAQRTSNQDVDVFWKTTSEINNLGFAVQRSLGNTSTFNDIGFVPADAFHAFIHRYRFNDGNDYQNISYYRLRQIDIDGHFVYSKIVPVKGYTLKEFIAVYPNPATTEILLKADLEKMDRVNISLFDNDGQLINQQTRDFFKGKNTINLNINRLAKGNYLIRVLKSDGTQLTTKFIKN